MLIGMLMCATVAWAALGFLLMGVGLISLQVAERSRRRTDVAAAVPAGLNLALTGPELQPPKFEPVVSRDGPPPPRQPRRVAWPSKSNGAPYDKEAWRQLVERDPDIAQLTNVLADYGPQYVDELAISYLAAPDKSRLGAIVDGIIARARGSRPSPPAAPPPGLRPPPVPADPAADLEASLIAAFEEASAKSPAERPDPPPPARAAEVRPSPVTRREPAFRSAPNDPKLGQSPPPVPVPLPASAPADLEASLIAAVAEASARRVDPPKPAPMPEPPPLPTKREPDIRTAPKEQKPVPPPVPPASTPADDLDESLLAALAEISGEKASSPADPVTPASAAKDPPSAPVDDDLSEMIKKFAPDSSFLRKQ
ncbi:hypothetical protein UP10_29720 [Bradyrhizobium sp. LTSPM299]|nr:hypothetical protein UP10_29720 [Bradyrhizobium sp. LTSPM299]